jgi:LemA protein
MSKSGKRILVVLAIILAVVLIAFNWFAGINNRFVNLDEGANAAWAQVENQLQRRFDLIPNLVNTVKGYAAHEEGVLTAVTEARARVGSARTIDEKIESNGQLTSALGRLLVVMENYPNLKADQNFLALQAQLEGTENRIAVERGRYNDAVQQYNQSIRRIPDSIIANMRGFERKKLFETTADAQKAPEVKF